MPPKDKRTFVKSTLSATPTIEEIVAEQAAKQSLELARAAEEVTEAAPAPIFDFVLCVRNPFLNYRKGHLIIDNDEIQSVITAGYLHHCCKTKI